MNHLAVHRHGGPVFLIKRPANFLKFAGLNGLNDMSTTTPHKPADSPPPATSAFGITIAAAQQSAVEKSGMNPALKKKLVLGGVILVLAAVSIWLRLPPKPDDPELSNPGVRKVQELQEKNDTAGLAQLAKSDDSMVARRAVQALASVGGADAIRDSLSDQRPDVRYLAVSGLGSSGDPSQLEALSDFIQNDPAPDVRIAAVRGVSNIRDFSIFDHLYPALNDPEESVRKAAFGAIQDRIGLKFPEYKADGSASVRAPAINRMRATIAGMKSVFDRDTEQQNHQKSNRK
jgi:hypothetical protein